MHSPGWIDSGLANTQKKFDVVEVASFLPRFPGIFFERGKLAATAYFHLEAEKGNCKGKISGIVKTAEFSIK
jgi:hypothetical protein